MEPLIGDSYSGEDGPEETRLVNCGIEMPTAPPEASPATTWVRPITPEQFALFRDLVHREAGIFLSDTKKSLLVGRLLRRLRARGLDSFEAYYEVVTREPTERVHMLDCICTNETRFFREPRQFDFLERVACPGWERATAAGRRPRHLRVWSAGCSTGEEPYSVAMALLARLPPASGWDLEILGTDLSTRALEQARKAVWPVEKATEIPAPLLKRFMLRGIGSEDGRMSAGAELRGVVTLRRLNLNEQPYPVDGSFDLILCRNVLIYFDRVAKEGVIDRLIDRLRPGGYLMLGHAESLIGITRRTRSVGPTVYVRVPDPAESTRSPRATRGATCQSRLSGPASEPPASPSVSFERASSILNVGNGGSGHVMRAHPGRRQ